MAGKIRVIILNGHHVGSVDRYRYRLSSASDIEVVGFALSGEELKRLLVYRRADVLLLDMDLRISPDNPNPNRILHVILDLLEHYCSLVILVISTYSEQTLINEVMDVGVKGYIFNNDRETIDNLASVIRRVAEGKVYLSQKASQQWRKQWASQVLTTRQAEVLFLCAAYPKLTTVKLAERLNVKPSSLRNLLSDAYRRLGVSNRKAAVTRAYELSLIFPNLASIEVEASNGNNMCLS